MPSSVGLGPLGIDLATSRKPTAGRRSPFVKNRNRVGAEDGLIPRATSRFLRE